MAKQKLTAVVIDALEDIKARDIVLINVSKLTSVFDYLALASADSTRQTKALAKNVMDRVKENGGWIYGTEGEQSGEWVLVDCGDVVVHIMQPAVREHYKLEELWGDGKIEFPKPARVKVAPMEATPAAKAPAKRKAAKAPATAKKPVAKKPSANSPVAKKPAVKKPTAKKPAAKKPAAKAPVTRKTAAKAPVAKKPATKKPVAKKPAAKKPAAKTPAAKTPAVKKPAARKPRSGAK